MKKAHKRTLCCLLAALLAVSLLMPSLAEESASITIMINQTWNKPSMEKLAKEYEALNPGVKIDYQVIPDNEFGQLLNAKMATKEVPEIVMDNYQSLAKTVNMSETFLDVRDQPWYPLLVNKDQIVIDGGAYLLPINGSSDPFGMVYNKKVYEACGVTQLPATYDEFLAVCEKIKAAGVVPVVLTGKDSWTIGMWTVTMFPNAVYNDPNVTWEDLNTGKIKFSQVEGFKAALGILNDLVARGFVNEDFLACTYDMGQQMISEDEAAMTLQGAWFINECTTKYPDTQFGMYPAPFVEKPKFASGQYSGFLAFKNAKHSEAAMKFLDFVAQPQNMEQISRDWNFIPPFEACNVELPYWIKDYVQNYLNKGDGPLEEMAITSAIEVGFLTTLTIDMLAGGQTADEVLANWDAKFEELATLRQLDGWVK